MNFRISQDLAQSLLDYLGQRPYVEVFQLIVSLQKLEPEGWQVPAEIEDPASSVDKN